MSVKPMLGDWEIPRVSAIDTFEKRHFVELPVPGRTGSLFQDLNTSPTQLRIAGSLFGEEARNQFLDDLRGKYRAGEPVTFTADIVKAADIQYVIIEDMHFWEDASDPDVTAFQVTLRESPPPPPPPDPLGGLDTSLLDQAGDFLDGVTGALDVLDALGNIPDISNPTEPLTNAMQGVTEATSGLDSALGGLQGIFGTDD